MDGRAFLHAAQDLAALATEAHWRTAAVSAYYALMLEGRDALERWGFTTPPRAGVHAFVRLTFAYATDPMLKDIGQALDELVRLRNQAHYQIHLVGSFANNQTVLKAIDRARKSIAVLNQIAGDPTQQTSAIAAIRAGRK